jgi:histidinol-phosphatase (PHP family)
MIFPDYHLHSEFSSDCDSDMHEIVKSAKANGLSSICITDHYDMDFPVRPDEPDMDFNLDAEKYYSFMSHIREEYAPDFDLRIGVELGVMEETCEKLEAYVAGHPEFDFIIASSHLVDGMDPYYPEFFSDKTDTEGYRLYFETILYNVKHFKNYNVYGHLDYILRYGKTKADNFRISDYSDLFKEIFQTIVYDGKGIEINTGSLYRGLDFPHPHADILRLYREAGGEIITVGSDAHKPKFIGYGFDKAKELLTNHGFRYYCTFRNMKPEFVKI